MKFCNPKEQPQEKKSILLNKNIDRPQKPRKTLKLCLNDENGSMFIPRRTSHKKLSIKLDIAETQVLKNSYYPSTVDKKQINQSVPQYNFSETVQNINIYNKNQRALWISRRGSINFYLMENQDHIIALEKDENYRIYGILDGNGKFGKKIAEQMGNRLIKFLVDNYRNSKQAYGGTHIKKNLSGQKINTTPRLQKSVSKGSKNHQKMATTDENEVARDKQNFEENFKKSVIEFIESENKKMMKNFSEEYKSSGCTLLFVVILKDKIFSFNIGASKSHIFREIEIEIEGKKCLSSFPIATEQTLSRFDQKARILSSPKAIIERSIDENNCRIGPERIWKKGQKFPGLPITRCLGMDPETLSELGIISTPECVVLQISDNFQFILMGSDGFWKVFESTKQVQKLISEYWSKQRLEQGIDNLLKHTVRKWNKKYELMDDISIMLIKLN